MCVRVRVHVCVCVCVCVNHVRTNLMASSRQTEALSAMARWNGEVPLKSGVVISEPEMEQLIHTLLEHVSEKHVYICLRIYMR